MDDRQTKPRIQESEVSGGTTSITIHPAQVSNEAANRADNATRFKANEKVQKEVVYNQGNVYIEASRDEQVAERNPKDQNKDHEDAAGTSNSNEDTNLSPQVKETLPVHPDDKDIKVHKTFKKANTKVHQKIDDETDKDQAYLEEEINVQDLELPI